MIFFFIGSVMEPRVVMRCAVCTSNLFVPVFLLSFNIQIKLNSTHTNHRNL